MYIVAGLGNPGLKYRKTPHNSGFMAADALAKDLDVRFSKKNFRAKVAEAFLGKEKLILLKPQTYMNNSGQSVAAAADFYGIDAGNVIVIYDDKDLPQGCLRIRAKGSPGSHNGMRSVTQCLGTEEFPRVRIGIGVPPTKMRLMNYVLHRLDRNEYKEYEKMAELAAKAVIEIIENGLEQAQQQYSSDHRRQQEK